MKKILSLLYMLPAIAISQSLAPGHYAGLHEHASTSGQRETIIWSEDFSAGIPSDWQNEEAGGIAEWEYRGPFTTPDMETGSQGLCTDQGAPGNVITSPTAGNGFVIFDSNWWDNPDLPCSLSNFGTGPAPAPHLAMLTTASIDLSAHPDVALRFNQFLRNYDAELRVEVSTDGIVWNAVYTNNVADLSQTDMQVQVPVSFFAGGEASVQFRFVFEGTYYFWQLDDVCIVEIFPNDLATSESTFGDFDFFDLSHPTGFELMEYTWYPEELAPLLKFSTQCENIGSNAQNDCRLNADVTNFNTSDVLHTAQSVEGFTIAPGETLELRAGNFQMPATVGDYQVHFFTSQTGEDENAMNNVDTSGFRISDCTYARDHGFTSAVFIPGLDVAALDYEIGNVFLMTAANQSCYSISTAIAAGTALPADIYARIYEFSAQTEISATLIATTDNFSIGADELNNYGEAAFMHLTFDAPIALQQGHAYLAVIGSTDGAENVYVAFSGQSPEYTSWVHFLPDQWFYLTGTPMVRMNFCTDIGTDDLVDRENTISIYPNPVNDQLTLYIPSLMHKNCCFYVSDMRGRIIDQQKVTSLSDTKHRLNISTLAAGVYTIRVIADECELRSCFVKW
ncbi:MAG: T9SS type A sorting domain-containing protein [Flavobacteriales bacterium]